MSRPHFFVWSGGVINLERLVWAEVLNDSLVIHLRGRAAIRLQGDHIGQFMLHCAEFHEAFINREAREGREGKGEG